MKKNNIKTTLIIVIGLALFVGLSFLIKTNGPGPKVEKEYIVSEWLEDSKGEEPVVTVIGMSTCGHCQSYKPVIEKLAEEKGFKLYFFESDLLPQNEATMIETTYELNAYEGYVPFTYIVQNGVVIAENTGYKDKETAVDFLKQNGVIK